MLDEMKKHLFRLDYVRVLKSGRRQRGRYYFKARDEDICDEAIPEAFWYLRQVRRNSRVKGAHMIALVRLVRRGRKDFKF
jgi:hypothetical protein